MLKSLTLSVSLAFALGACGVSFAGGHGKSMPTPQGPIASEQVLPSEQCETGCAPACAPKKPCFLAGLKKMCTPKPKCYTYTWVLKKKKCGGLFGFGHKHNSNCGGGGCDEGVYPSGQYASPQVEPTSQAWNGGGYGSAQGYGSGQSYGYGTGQGTGGGAGVMMPAPTPVPAGDEAPAAPTPPTTSLGMPSPNATAGLLNLAPAGE